MLHTLRKRINDERGFTLIELLVVILIIGILAAIAIPSFISQKDKAGDASAKSFVRNMQTAQETYFTDNNAYANSLASLQTIEPVLNDVPNRGGTAPTATNTPAGGFTVTATSTKGVTYTITRAQNGQTTRTCDRPNVGAYNGGSSLVSATRVGHEPSGTGGSSGRPHFFACDRLRRSTWLALQPIIWSCTPHRTGPGSPANAASR